MRHTKEGQQFFIAAGNDGHTSWKYISTPADAYVALTIGPSDIDGSRSDFSSFDINSSTIKPDIMDYGNNVIVFPQSLNNINTNNRGTSLTSPIALGTAILLKRLNPDITNSKIYQKIRQGGNRHSFPNPLISSSNNFVYIKYNDLVEQSRLNSNPKTPKQYVSVYTSLGKRVKNIEVNYDKYENQFIINIKRLSAGIYFFKIEGETFKLLLIK